MTDEAALIAAILADREDDTARLAYADWLDENDRHERAEFIRVQVELARFDIYEWPKGSNVLVLSQEDGLRVDELRGRERELWDANGVLWLRQCRSLVDGTFRRGFPYRLTCSWETWRTHAAAIVAAQPIERVKLTTTIDLKTAEDLGRRRGEPAEDFLERTWPGIEFELPAENAGVGARAANITFID